MSEHSKNVSKQTVEAIQAAAKRACDGIREDADQAIADLKSRADALYQIEIEGNGRFAGKGDHLFAREIDLTRGFPGKARLGGAAIHLSSGERWGIGSGPNGIDGARLEQGKRYRMIVAFQQLGEDPAKGKICASCKGPIEDSRPNCNKCRACDGGSSFRQQLLCTICKKAKREQDVKDGVCSQCEADAIKNGDRIESVEETGPRRELYGPRNMKKLLNEAYGELECCCNGMEEKWADTCLKCRIEQFNGGQGNRTFRIAEQTQISERTKKIMTKVGYAGRSGSLNNEQSLADQLQKIRDARHCMVCNDEIYMGNCCSEACVKKWMTSIKKANTAMSEGRRACRNCGEWHEFKSNYCGKCDLDNKA